MGEEIECPHGCGHVLRDLWDYDWSGGHEEIITECGECLKPITIHRHMSVSYTCTADEVP